MIRSGGGAEFREKLVRVCLGEEEGGFGEGDRDLSGQEDAEIDEYGTSGDEAQQ